ncbi:hypothetical protein GCM10010275_23500 [Streptomyces litmocidini]|nr:hypothetical protein GCM10010275_23500 [Streptomyces litmocidini]
MLRLDPHHPPDGVRDTEGRALQEQLPVQGRAVEGARGDHHGAILPPGAPGTHRTVVIMGNAPPHPSIRPSGASDENTGLLTRPGSGRPVPMPPVHRGHAHGSHGPHPRS